MSQTIAVGGDAPSIVTAMKKVLGVFGFEVFAFPAKPKYPLLGVPDYRARWSSFDVSWRCWESVAADGMVWCTVRVSEAKRICACLRSYSRFVAASDSAKLIVIYPAVGNRRDSSPSTASLLHGMPGLSVILDFLGRESGGQRSSEIDLGEYRAAMNALLHDIYNGLFWTGESRRNNAVLARSLFEGLREDLQELGWVAGAETCRRTLEFTGDPEEETTLREEWLNLFRESAGCMR